MSQHISYPDLETTKRKPAPQKPSISKVERLDEARRAAQRAQQGTPTRSANREPSQISLDRAADEGMIPPDLDDEN